MSIIQQDHFSQTNNHPSIENSYWWLSEKPLRFTYHTSHIPMLYFRQREAVVKSRAIFDIHQLINYHCSSSTERRIDIKFHLHVFFFFTFTKDLRNFQLGLIQFGVSETIWMCFEFANKRPPLARQTVLAFSLSLYLSSSRPNYLWCLRVGSES